jgi:HKD family nuclease
MSKKSQSIFLANSENKQIIDYISDLFERSYKIDIAVAFLSFGGWELIKPILSKWITQNNRKIRLLVRKDRNFPHKKAVNEINEIDNIDFKYYQSRNFHAKQWIFYIENSVYVLIGSANLTRNGLINNAEANILTKLTLNDPELQKIEDTFQEWWKNSQYFPIIKIWKGVVMTIQGMNMSFNLKDLSLEELVWLKEHNSKNPEIYKAQLQAVRPNTPILEVKFDVKIESTGWSDETMNCLNEVINRFNLPE